jgi:regulator of sigma E protease
MDLILFIIAFGLLVFLHELGHFLMARVFKIEVEEFGFGFPPRIVKLFTLSGTDFTLNWIPFGGFVRPKGENDPTVEGGLAAASPWKRLGVLFGGPVMNLLTGILVFAFVASLGRDQTPNTIDVADVAQGSPAQTAGLQVGDVIISVNGKTFTNQDQFRSVIASNLGKEIQITYVHQGKTIDARLTPRANPPEGQGAMGISMVQPKLSVTEALSYGAQQTYEQAKALVLLPGRLIHGQISPQDSRVVGPVGMYDIFKQVRQRDAEQQQAAPAGTTPPAEHTLFLIATISVALGLTNLLPIPALDGGRILFIIPELILRRRVPAEYENLIHLIGFAALIVLMVYVTAQDFINPIVLPR